MIDVGSFRAGHCQSLDRRSFLRIGTALPVASALPFLSGSSETCASDELGKEQELADVRARSIILLWLWGGPSHIDTFDPKPDAPSEYRGPFATIPTRVPGVRFSEVLPLLARRNDGFTLIRSHINHNGGHLPAGSIGLTGTRESNGRYGPNFGSIVGRFRPSELPPFMALGRSQLKDAGGTMKGYGGGTWGSGYDPFPVECDDRGEVEIPGLTLLDGLSPARLGDRRRLREELDGLTRRAEGRATRRWDVASEKAYSMLASAEGRRAFDLSSESESTRGAYGYTTFGQSCLLARRLVEVAVPYVQVNWSVYVEPFLGDRTDFGWDTHANNFELLVDRHGPILDRALSALLDDLRDRGLLDSTLVVCMGEFGRTPRINGNAARDHWPQCYSSIWAGAGVSEGKVIGESDRLAERPITEPITPEMVGTTMLEFAGVTAEDRAKLRVLQNGSVVPGLQR